MKITLIVSLESLSSDSTADQRLAQLEEKIQKLQAKRATYTKNKTVLDKAVAKLKKDGKRVPAATKKEIEALQEQLDDADKKIATLEGKVKALSSKDAKKDRLLKPSPSAPARMSLRERMQQRADQAKQADAIKESEKTVQTVRMLRAEDLIESGPAMTKEEAANLRLKKERELKELDEKLGIHPTDTAVTLRVGVPERFRLAGTDSSMLKHIEAVWEKANEVLFEGKMKKPRFSLLKGASASNFTKRGLWSWNGDSGTLSISPHLYSTRREAFVVGTIVHEMCHQYNTEVDRLSREEMAVEAGHGPEWRRRMEIVGLVPSRYSKYDNVSLMGQSTRRKETLAKVNAKMSDRTPAKRALSKLTMRTVLSRVSLSHLNTKDTEAVLDYVVLVGYKSKVQLYVLGLDRKVSLARLDSLHLVEGYTLKHLGLSKAEVDAAIKKVSAKDPGSDDSDRLTGAKL